MKDDDLVKRLRANTSWGDDRFAEAADRIEALTAERDRLQREVKDLKKLVCAAYCEGFSDGKDGGWIVGPSNQPWKASDAHKALNGESHE